MKKRGQTSIEFMIFVGIAIMVFVIYSLLASYYSEKVHKEGEVIEAGELAQYIKTEINLASSAEEGYSKTISLQEDINNKEYVVNIELRSISVLTEDTDYVEALSSDVTFNIGEGAENLLPGDTLTITKLNNIVTIEKDIFGVLGRGAIGASCSERNGIICKEGEACQGTWISASDTEKCCSGACVPKTCSQQSGYICTEDESCKGEVLTTNDITPPNICCSTPCTDKTCDEKNGHICSDTQRCDYNFISAYDTTECCQYQCTDVKCSDYTNPSIYNPQYPNAKLCSYGEKCPSGSELPSSDSTTLQKCCTQCQQKTCADYTTATFKPQICTKDETCTGNILTASDTNKCCDYKCIAKTCSGQGGTICTKKCDGSIKEATDVKTGETCCVGKCVDCLTDSDCGTGKCALGKCAAACTATSGCKNDEYINTQGSCSGDSCNYCLNNDVYRTWRDWTCSYPETVYAQCTYQDFKLLQTDCGSITYGNAYCKDGDVYKDETKKGCSNNACYSSTTPVLWQNCEGNQNCNAATESCLAKCSSPENCGESGKDYGKKYCYQGDVYIDKIYWTCLKPGAANSECLYTLKENLVKDCGTATCQLDANNEAYCKTKCTLKTDCGVDSYVSSITKETCSGASCYYCNNNDIYANYRTYSCINPGTTAAQCSYLDTPLLQSDCGDTTYSDAYCQNGDVYKDETKKGCSNNACYTTTSAKLWDDCIGTEKCANKVDTCQPACLPGAEADSCGNLGYTGKTYCSNGDIYQDYVKKWTCLIPRGGAATELSSCIADTEARLKQDCGTGTCKINANNEAYCETKCTANTDCGTGGYVGDSYCTGEDLFRNYTTYACINPRTTTAECFTSTSISMLYEDCGTGSCSNAQCTWKCYTDSDCPADKTYNACYNELTIFGGDECALSQNKDCGDQDIYQININNYCSQPATKDAQCLSNKQSTKIQECGTDWKENSSCLDNNTVKYTEHDKGCEYLNYNVACYDKTTPITKDCAGTKICKPTGYGGVYCDYACSSILDCNSSNYWEGNQYCGQVYIGYWANAVMDKYCSYTCMNPDTSLAYCSGPTCTNKQVEICGGLCENAKCVSSKFKCKSYNSQLMKGSSCTPNDIKCRSSTYPHFDVEFGCRYNSRERIFEWKCTTYSWTGCSTTPSCTAGYTKTAEAAC